VPPSPLRGSYGPALPWNNGDILSYNTNVNHRERVICAAVQASIRSRSRILFWMAAGIVVRRLPQEDRVNGHLSRPETRL
jgi:hypothetical protein